MGVDRGLLHFAVIVVSAGLCLSCTKSSTPTVAGKDNRPSSVRMAKARSDEAPSPTSAKDVATSDSLRISVSLLPELPRAGDTFRTKVESHTPDSHPSLDYQWLVNDEESVGERGETFHGHVVRGDKVSVRVTPSDGMGTGLPVTVSRYVENSPPLVTSLSAPSFDGARYQTRLEASDPDGDPLEFAIVEGPGGISIDDQGWIRWQTAGAQADMHVVVASVKDGQGGEIVYSYRFTLGRSQGSPPQD